MRIVRAVFEHGIELRFVSDRWIISSAESDANVGCRSLSESVDALSPFRLVLVTEKRNYGGDLTLLLREGSNEYFNVRVSELMGSSSTEGSMYTTFHLKYLLGAVSYHCERLAELYVQIARYCEIVQIPGRSDSSCGFGTFGYQLDPYFEFDALVGAARRSYDSTRYILWRQFGAGSTPRSLEALLKTQSRIPESLRERLNASWQTFGIPLTHYRDCIHHYVPVDFGLSSAWMQRTGLRAWSTTIRIPDNPEVQSKKRFTFNLDRDALTYAWALADELLSVAIDVMKAGGPFQSVARARPE